MTAIRFEESDDIIDICRDNVFKAVFTKDSPESGRALAGLLTCFTRQKLSVVEVTTNEPSVEDVHDRQIRFDIACEDEKGRLFNVEITMYPDAGHRRMAVRLMTFLSANNPKGRIILNRCGLSSMLVNYLLGKIFAAKGKPLTI